LELSGAAVRLAMMCAELVNELSQITQEIASLQLERAEEHSALRAATTQAFEAARVATMAVAAQNRLANQRATELLAQAEVTLARLRATRGLADDAVSG